jgi:4-amino-4-deoxy-L-arabinose transferase-like glycosyltransferase
MHSARKLFHKIVRQKTYLVLYLAIALAAGSIIWTKYDTVFQYKWLILTLHSSAMLIIGSIYIYKTWPSIKRHVATITRQEISLLTILFISALCVSFFALSTYPFVSLGDEVRDGGLDAMKIVNGVRDNIFEYGSYDAHGLIIPTIASFFYRLFGSSVLTYRVPAALLSIADVLILYILLRKITNKTAAFFGGLTLLTLPLHMFFGRTELVVIFNSFWTSVILLLLYLTCKKTRIIDYALIGTVLGFAGGFHAAIRVVAIFALGIIIVHTIYAMYTSHGKLWKRIQTPFASILVLLIFCTVGFGPRAIYTTKDNFFHTKRFSYNAYVETRQIPSLTEVEQLKEKYIKSLMVWFYEPTNFFYPDQKPILPPLLTIIWLLGVGYSFFILRKPFLFIPLFYAFALPFTNSAITDTVNADHRLSVLLPIAAFFIGVGIYYIQKSISFRYLSLGILVFIATYISVNTISYYRYQPANKNKDFKEYVAMHTIYFLQDIFPQKKNGQGMYRQNTCIALSPTNYYTFNLLHYREQFEYFLPNLLTEMHPDGNLSDTEVHIYNGQCSQISTITRTRKRIQCNTSSLNYHCPLQYAGIISVYYDEPQNAE